MRQPVPIISAIVMLLIATVLQQGFLGRYLLFGSQMELPLVVVLSFALVSRPAAGGALGLLSGVLTGGLSGVTLTYYALSRVIGGYILGTRADSEPDYRAGAAWVAAGTLISKLIMILLAPPPAVMPALGATILSAVYNGVVAIPVFALIQRLFRPKVV